MSKTPQSSRPSKAGQSVPKEDARSTTDVDRALALRDVMDHVVKTQREITKPTVIRARRARRILATLICVPLIALSVYSWLERPEFIWGPSNRSVPAARQDANTRLAIYLTARRIESFRKRQGALPVSLAAIGEDRKSITYRVVSDSVFELHAVRDGTPIVFRSNEPAAAFLGSAPKVIAEQAK